MVLRSAFGGRDGGASDTPGRARRAITTIALAALAACAVGCGDDEPAEAKDQDDRAIVKLSFDEVAYVDVAISTRKMIERVRRQNESIFATLRRADVMITAKRVVDVDLAHLEKDPVTVIDLETGITRSAVRLRYHFVALALAPKALALRGDVPLGALHNSSPTKPELVLATCSANGDRERAAITELWTVFDASIDRCAAAINAEQATIDVARKKLARPDKEIVSMEFERLYMPVMAHLTIRETHRDEPGQGDWQASGEGGGAPIRQLSWADKARERDSADAEDERELSRLSRPAQGGPSQGNAVLSWGSAVYSAPNFTLLYVAVVALVLLLVGWRQQDRKRRR